MQYYLETNALYNLSKLRKDILREGFTSAFAILELIGGINEQEYHRRHKVAVKIREYKIPIDWALPEQIIFESFDFFRGNEFIDSRIKPLSDLLVQLSESENYERFKNSLCYNDSKYGWKFFFNLDRSMNENFVRATMNGNKAFRKAIMEENEIEFDGKKHRIETGKELESFLLKYPVVNESFTIQSLSLKVMKLDPDVTEEAVYTSYNNRIPIYVNCFSRYCSDKACNLNDAAGNDIQDLTHLLYLRNKYTWKIVSNDSLYKKYIPNLVKNW